MQRIVVLQITNFNCFSNARIVDIIQISQPCCKFTSTVVYLQRLSILKTRQSRFTTVLTPLALVLQFKVKTFSACRIFHTPIKIKEATLEAENFPHFMDLSANHERDGSWRSFLSYLPELRCLLVN